MRPRAGLEFYYKWLDYVGRKKAALSSSDVYFVQADIEDAFGSTLHGKLQEILADFRNRFPAEMTAVHVSCVAANGRRGRNFRLISFLNKWSTDWTRKLPVNSVLIHLGKEDAMDVTKLFNVAIRSVTDVRVSYLNKRYVLQRRLDSGSRRIDSVIKSMRSLLRPHGAPTFIALYAPSARLADQGR